MSTALIDADIIAYSVGFAVDKTYYMYGKKKFKYHKTGKKWCMDQGIDWKEALVKHHEAGDLEETLETVDTLVEQILEETGSEDYMLFLTGKNNFRKELAVTHEYKGNRDRSKVPHNLTAIVEHLKDKWGAIVVNNQEADDALGISQCEASLNDEPIDTVICSIDKDLLMIPGWHYNWVRNSWHEVTEFEGWKHFYKQLLTGDKTDNIIGIHGVGEKTAEFLLSQCTNLESLLCAVGLQYAIAFDDPEARMLENANLLYIRRCENDSWNWEKHSEQCCIQS